MTGRADASPYDVGVWPTLSRRLSPYLDPAVGIVAAGFAVASLLTTQPASIDPRLLEPDVLSVLATTVAGLALTWRRVRPLASYLVFASGCLVVSGTYHYIGLLSVLLLVSLYSLAAHGRRRDGVLGLVVGLASFAALALAGVPDLRTSDLVQAGALLVTAWAVGDAIRSRRTQQREQLRAAEREAVVAREQATRGITDERLRIARDLHDVVAHSMSLIAVQAGVGGHVIRTDVDAAEHALVVIAETSRDALTQTRAMLGLLRDQDSAYDEPPAQRIVDLDALVDRMREAGVEVVVDVDGEPRPLDPGVELAAYHVVQESLTNVVRHSGSDAARVHVGYMDTWLDVDVRDRGGRAPVRGTTPPSGYGLLGLRERARLLGGTLDFGPMHGGGFQVTARLPIAALS